MDRREALSLISEVRSLRRIKVSVTYVPNPLLCTVDALYEVLVHT